MKIKKIHSDVSEFPESIEISGWLRNLRKSKNVSFLDINDGSCFQNLQIIIESSLVNFKKINELNIGSSLLIKGKVVNNPNNKNQIELLASHVEIIHNSANDYPIQKKKHGLDFLRTIPHLRSRTNTFSSVFRLRSTLALSIHEFFNNKDFYYINTPIITSSDCEGAGEMFQIEQGKKDFFSKPAYLTVSGQLEAEAFALSLGNIYTFGPTFRAENSHTTRHASEFWMIEPEMAFTDLNECIKNAEEMIKFIIDRTISQLPEEMEFFNKFYEKDLLSKLNNVLESTFEIITYTEAIKLLLDSKIKFNYPVSWGIDLKTEHERYITESIFKKPVFVVDYPKDIKAFYCRSNDDNKTVAAVDLLVPGIGEIIGGSQREERYDILEKNMIKTGMSVDDYSWYLDLRKYGAAKCSGYGLGFDRMIMYMTGISNIRDVLPFPRTPGSIF